jgi:exodeoxyribonuclease VII large subunit
VAQTAPRPEGIPGVSAKGPFPVGQYAAFLRDRFKEIARVQVFGEVWNLRIPPTGARLYFELRDSDGALPCSMWRNEYERSAVQLADGAQVVLAGGTSYYPGSKTASPSFSFDVTGLRLAGEGDLLVRLEALRRKLDAEGLFAPQKALHRPALPRCIGVVTGEGGKARDDVLAGLHRRGWAGRLVWAFAPVQDRHAAPRIAQALQDLAAIDEVEVIVVARGGGSLADLFAFCDETLCRTVALLRTPVIASVGHHTDRPLIDDVAAVRCSTPTHAAETAVPCDVGEAQAALRRSTGRLAHYGRTAILGRARHLAQLSRAPAEVVARHRRGLHQMLREIRRSAQRGVQERRGLAAVQALVLSRKAAAGAGPERTAQRSRLDSLAAALDAHDPERVVERGYAIVDDGEGNVLTSAQAARAARRVRLFFGDGDVRARIEE